MAFRKILIIIMRSNGDVYLSLPVIDALREDNPDATIDLLVFHSTKETAWALDRADNVYTYTYEWKANGRLPYILKQLLFIKSLFGKYDLSISLTASDRSTLYSIISSKVSIGAYDNTLKTSWWKRLLLHHSYHFDQDKHIVQNNIEVFKLLNISSNHIQVKGRVSDDVKQKVRNLLRPHGIKKFIIFHPSTQYEYKIYPKAFRNELLAQLDSLGIPIVITGASTPLDERISLEIPPLKNVYNFIGKTTLEEIMGLSFYSMAYVGMDTLNMHIAASFDKRVFAIFGPTLIHRWSPWSNVTGGAARVSHSVQHYGNITIFQADLPCVPCGLQGCQNDFGTSECLQRIDPDTIFHEVRKWLSTSV
jgi:heptosyltransferase III